MKSLNSQQLIGITCAFLSLLIITHAGAQQTEIASSLNPVGSGARAAGMGGAFIGVADDATAASWNPAGLVQLEKPELSAVYSYFARKQTYESGQHPEVDSDQHMDAAGLNYASLAFPFSLLKRNMIVSINYQRMFEMNKDYRFDFISESAGMLNITDESGWNDFRQEGFLYTLSPAAAVQVTPAFSIGVTYNMWDNFFGKNGWEIHNHQADHKTIVFDFPLPVVIDTESRSLREDDTSFEGKNFHFGFLWKLFGSITLGGVYKTPFDADVIRKSTITTQTITKQEFAILPSTETIETNTVAAADKFIMRMPASYGLGISYNYSDNLTFALDMYRTEWSRFVLRNREGDETDPLTGAPVSEGRLKDTTQIRAGTEYLFFEGQHIVPVRFGLFYDPEPSKGHLDDYYGASFGIGYAGGKAVLDLSYQIRVARNVTSDFPAAEDSDPDIYQHTAMCSVIYYFDDQL